MAEHYVIEDKEGFITKYDLHSVNEETFDKIFNEYKRSVDVKSLIRAKLRLVKDPPESSAEAIEASLNNTVYTLVKFSKNVKKLEKDRNKLTKLWRVLTLMFYVALSSIIALTVAGVFMNVSTLIDIAIGFTFVLAGLAAAKQHLVPKAFMLGLVTKIKHRVR